MPALSAPDGASARTEGVTWRPLRAGSGGTFGSCRPDGARFRTATLANEYSGGAPELQRRRR